MQFAKLQVRGALTKAAIEKVLERHLHVARACYREALSADPKLAGTLTLEFTIAADGRVFESKTRDTARRGGHLDAIMPTSRSSALGNHSVGRCLGRAVRCLRFPRPTKGGLVIAAVKYTLGP